MGSIFPEAGRKSGCGPLRPAVDSGRGRGAHDAGALPARIARLRELPLSGHSAAQRHERLSPRELQVLILLSTELSAAEIAAELFISANTARSHIKAIHRKLAVTNRLDAVAAATGAGLIG